MEVIRLKRLPSLRCWAKKANKRKVNMGQGKSKGTFEKFQKMGPSATDARDDRSHASTEAPRLLIPCSVSGHGVRLL